MSSVMSKLCVDSLRKSERASKRRRVDEPKATVPTPPGKPIRLPCETLLDVALFLNRLDVDAIQFTCQRHRAFVEDHAHLVPLRDLAQISFEYMSPEGGVNVRVLPTMPRRPRAGTVQSIEFTGTWGDVLAAKDLFQNVVRYAVPYRLRLATPEMKWDFARELFGDTPLTIRVARELIIGEQVEPSIDGIQEFLRHFALVNCLKFTHMRHWVAVNHVADKCDDRFLQWCVGNSITQLDVDEQGATLTDHAVLDFCFGPHGNDSDPRHLKGRFQCRGDFVARLLDANRKCTRHGSITMDITARGVDAPNVAELAPYKVEEAHRNGFDESEFLIPEEFDLKIVCSYRARRGLGWPPSECHIEVYRPARQI